MQTYMTITIVISSVLSLLMGIIIIFLRQQINTTKSLNDSVNILNNVVGNLETKTSYNERYCSEKHQVLDRRVDQHSAKIRAHDIDIANLKAIRHDTT